MGKLQHVRAFRGKERVVLQVIECCVYMAAFVTEGKEEMLQKKEEEEEGLPQIRMWRERKKTVDGWCVKLDPMPRWRLLFFFFFFNFCQFAPWVFGVIPSSNSSTTLPPFRYGYLQAGSICSSTPSSSPCPMSPQRKKRKPVQLQNKEEKKGQQIQKKTFSLGNFYFSFLCNKLGKNGLIR